MGKGKHTGIRGHGHEGQFGESLEVSHTHATKITYPGPLLVNIKPIYPYRE